MRQLERRGKKKIRFFPRFFPVSRETFTQIDRGRVVSVLRGKLAQREAFVNNAATYVYRRSSALSINWNARIYHREHNKKKKKSVLAEVNVQLINGSICATLNCIATDKQEKGSLIILKNNTTNIYRENFHFILIIVTRKICFVYAKDA